MHLFPISSFIAPTGGLYHVIESNNRLADKLDDGKHKNGGSNSKAMYFSSNKAEFPL